GAMENSMSDALNRFTSQAAGFSFPFVGAGWSSVTSFGNSGVSQLNFSEFLASMRRIYDEVGGLAARYREIETRHQNALPRETPPGATTGSAPPRPASPQPSLLAVKPRSEDDRRLDEERLKEMRARPPTRSPSNPHNLIRSRWYVSVLSPEQGSLCVNDDGRAL